MNYVVYPNILTPNYVKKYAKIWVSNRKGKQSLDLVDRVLDRVRSNPRVAVFANGKDDTTGPIPKTFVFEESSLFSLSGKKAHILEILPKTKSFTVDKLFTYPNSSVHYVIPHSKRVITVSVDISVYVYLEFSAPTFSMPDHVRTRVLELLRTKAVDSIVFECVEEDPKGTHATLLFYSVPKQMIYYINPWGSLTPKDREVSFAQWRIFFQTVLQVTLKGAFNTWDICPYPIQGVEDYKKSKGLVGLCRLWSLMLMTKYVELGSSPRKMVQDLFDPKVPSKHPFVVMNEWMKSLKLPLTPKPGAFKIVQKPVKSPKVIKNPVKNPKPCKEGKVRNPQTQRCISKTGKVYKDLVRQGILSKNDKRKSPKESKESKSKSQTSKCKEGTVLNPATKRCISKTGKVYKDLVKAGKI